jgi:ssDNA-binding Zn-finger/Zn-ribbon topoisomerase 1
MTNKNKTLVMIAIIVVCLVSAAAITYKKDADYRQQTSKSAGIETIDPADMIWVKCVNPDCEAEYQTGKRAYFQYLQDHQPPPAQFMAMMRDPNVKSLPGLLCNECSEETAYRAEKCDKCDLVFLRGSVRHDFADRCTGCQYSKTEYLRKKAREVKEQTEE